MATQRAPQARRARGRVTLSTEEDEFTGRVLHRLRIEFTSRESLTALASPGEPQIAILVHSSGPEWEYLECHHVAGLADDVRLSALEVEHRGRVIRGGVSEHVIFQLAEPDVRAMANAERIRFRICTTVYELPPSVAAAFTELYRRTFGALDADTDAAVDAGAEPDAGVTE